MQDLLKNYTQKEKTSSPVTLVDELPGPTGIPLLGNLLQLNTQKLHRVLEAWSNKYGAVYKFKLGPKTIVVFTAPQAIQFVLKNRPETFRRIEKMDDLIREIGVFGVFNAEGNDWKTQRKLVSQALNVQNLKLFFPTLAAITTTLMNRFDMLAAKNASVDIISELMRYTVDVTSRLAFGYEMNTINRDENFIQNHLEIIFPTLYNRINFPVPYWRWIQLPADKKLERSLQVIHKIMQEVIDKAREQLIQDPELQNHPTNFLQAMIAASDKESPVTNQVITSNVLTMLLAGEDTTAHTIAWIFYFMQVCPGVQQKMQEEADQVLANENIMSRYDDAVRLPYIEAVAMEAMRLKPVAPLLFHEALRDVVVDGLHLPAGTGVVLQTQYASIQETHFSHAEAFIPERWMTGGCPALQAHNDKAFVPFGAGARFCPGYSLAMLEIKAVLAMVCRNYEVKMETNADLVHEVLAFTMRPSDFFIRLVKRT